MTEHEGLQPAERLWTPWRMSYVGGGTSGTECVFCRALTSDDDSGHLVIHRGAHAFVIMNLYPYNTGHIMVVPNNHQHDFAALPQEARAEMAELTASFMTGLQIVLKCEGFNTGMNLGAVAGAGIADHLHQHIVPRWRGDANFMPIVGSTKVLPELIPATYAKIRADIALQQSGLGEAVICAFDRRHEHILMNAGYLPRVQVAPGSSAWPAVLRWLETRVASADLIGWVGSASTRDDETSPPAFEVVVSAETRTMLSVEHALATLSEDERNLVHHCLARCP